MEFRLATGAETTTWNARILANPDGGHILQGDEFAEQKKLSGWTPLYLITGDVAITVHEKSVFGLGKLWYIPKGPGVSTVVQLGDMVPALRDFAAANGAFVVKVEPVLKKTPDATIALEELGLLPVKNIQPDASTVLIDLSPDLETVMAGLNQKGRHAIHRAERDGVTIQRVESNEENCRIFYDLFTQTAHNASFVIRSYEYYKRFWQRYAAAHQGQMFFASFNGQVVSCAFAVVFGEKSTYKDGASIRVDGAYGTSHLLQWHVIQWAKEHGSLQHDLCGAPPSDRINDETHPYYGFGRFKTSFNKQVTDYVGAYDIVVKPREYSLWTRFGERITKRLWWRRHHESWY